MQEHSIYQPSDTTEPDSPRAWLEHFPAQRRSAIANWFYSAVRNGAHSPEAVVSMVEQEVLRRRQWVRDAGEQTHLQTVIEVLKTNGAGALAYAQEVITWEALPYEARQQRKAERARRFQQEHMAGLLVTDAQLAYLRALGHAGAPPANRAEASNLIDVLLSAQRGARA